MQWCLFCYLCFLGTCIHGPEGTFRVTAKNTCGHKITLQYENFDFKQAGCDNEAGSVGQVFAPHWNFNSNNRLTITPTEIAQNMNNQSGIPYQGMYDDEDDDDDEAFPFLQQRQRLGGDDGEMDPDELISGWNPKKKKY